jgi:Ca-activated chloride channel family protein
VIVTVAALAITRSATDGGCGDVVVLRLAVAPEVSPLIERAANPAGDCPTVTLAALESGRTSETLAADGFDGWVPASSAWLHLTGTAASPPGSTATPEPSGDGTAEPSPPGGLAGSAPVSLVRTPLVVAAPRPLAEALGWPRQQPTWGELAAAVVQGRVSRFTMDSPLRTPTGLLGVLGVHTAMSQTTSDPGVAQMRALTLRSRLADADADPTGLLRQLAAMSDPDLAAEDVGAFPVTEQALWAYQQAEPAVPLAALYPADGLMEADYPLALTPAAATDPGRLAAANRLIARFHSAELAPTIAESGFRPASAVLASPGPDGPAEGAPAEAGLLERYPEPAVVPADPAVVTARAHQWAGYQRLAFQTLVLVDASGSMNDPVRDRGGDRTTKAELLRAAGTEAADLFGPDTSLGIWMFATPTPDSPPYVEVVPLGPLDEPLGGVPRREVVRSVSESYQAFEQAGTPLFETVLRAIAAMQPLVKPDTVTMVVVLTDGRDEDTPFATGRLQFLSRLGEVQDRERPVPVFCIGYGADADMQALTDIANATGGRAVASNDPGDLASAIAQVFLAAHGVR